MMLVVVCDEIVALVTFSLTRLFAAEASKLVPDTVRAVPAVPIVGVKLVIVGTVDCVTVNDVLLVAVPPDVVTEIAPEVDPEGTVVVSFVAVAAVTVANVPLNLTVLSFGVVLNPVP